VACDDQGKPFTVRYEEVNAMLLNEFIKAHRKPEEQGATIAEQQREIEPLAATVKEQAAQIQNVSAQMSMTRPAPRLVIDNQ
jgi:hypothetical protein